MKAIQRIISVALAQWQSPMPNSKELWQKYLPSQHLTTFFGQT
jgi:hypothetical protein